VTLSFPRHRPAAASVPDGDDPVATIARHLGFTEPTNFTKFFARRTGTTPADFRRTANRRTATSH